MALISRVTKGNASTSWNDGDLVEADELNGDFDVVVTAINGGLNAANIAASAGIELTQLDGFGDTDTESRTETNPGVSGSVSGGATMNGELQRLRYAINQVATSVSATHFDGTTRETLYYGDTPVRGANLIRNGSFELFTTVSPNAPNGWALVGTPVSTAQVTTAVSNGVGKAMRVVASASQAEGIQQSLAGLKASTRYYVSARVSVTTGTCHVITVGADSASNFRDDDISVTGATVQTVAFVVQTDSTPAAIALQFLSDANATADDFTIDDVRFHECAAGPSGPAGYLAIMDDSTTSSAGNVTTTHGIFPPADVLAVVLTVPGPGFSIRVRAKLCVVGGATQVFVATLTENGADVDVSTSYVVLNAGASATLEYLNTTVTPGTTYTYTTEASVTTGTATSNGTVNLKVTRSNLIAELIPPS